MIQDVRHVHDPSILETYVIDRGDLHYRPAAGMHSA